MAMLRCNREKKVSIDVTGLVDIVITEQNSTSLLDVGLHLAFSAKINHHYAMKQTLCPFVQLSHPRVGSHTDPMFG